MNPLIELVQFAGTVATVVYGALALASIMLLIFDRPPAVAKARVIEMTEEPRSEERRAA